MTAAARYLEGLFGLAGKTALVTGGATGIGRMIAEGLALAGARVLIASRKADACAATAEAVSAAARAAGGDGRAEGFGGDVATEDGVTALAEAVTARSPELHILVNNAGVSWGAPLAEFPREAWDKVMGVNVAGLFSLTRALSSALAAAARAEDPARIVNIGSVMGARPIADNAYAYAASKAATHHLTEIFANEFASRWITCNALAPGPFRSRMTAFVTEDAEKAAVLARAVPLGRLGRAEDVAAAALYLCGPGGAYVTGAVIPVDGGLKVQAPISLFPRA